MHLHRRILHVSQHTMLIRNFKPADADELRQVFYLSVHDLARNFYTPEQLDVWAPESYDKQSWLQRLSANNPFVATIDGQIAGFADLQSTGYIDQFFVASSFARRGVGATLMHHILGAALDRRIDHVYSHVSLAAEQFFSNHGFSVTERRVVRVKDIEMANARMERSAG